MRLFLGVALALLMFGYRSMGSDRLEGSAWDIRLKRAPLLPLSRKDKLVFDRGRFSSARYMGSGFRPAGYSFVDKDKAISTWEASLVREDGSVLDWSGRVDGDRIRGTLIWTMKNGRRRTYSFRGRRSSIF